MRYNGWYNWDTWNAYNWLTSDYYTCKYFEDPETPLELWKQEAIVYLTRINEKYNETIDINILDWEELYLAFQEE